MPLKCSILTSSGTYTPVSGVTAAWLSMIGGGAGTKPNDSGNAGATTGGGGAGELVDGMLVPTSAPCAVVVGSGGAKGTVADQFLCTGGGDTSFGVFVAKGAPAPEDESHSGAGGGINGGTKRSFTSGPGFGNVGSRESARTYGGPAGGPSGSATHPGCDGATYGGPTTAGGTASGSNAGGGGGATTQWGAGGTAGTGSSPTPANGVGYGTGAGGAGGGAQVDGALGAPGVLMAFYVGP